MPRTLIRSVLWRRLDSAGLESCRLWKTPGGFQFEGTVLINADDGPAEGRYDVQCSETWETLAATVMLEVGSASRSVEFRADETRRWRADGTLLPELDGLHDIDLALSPCTNTLPIRRLSIGIGQSAEVNAVWVRFPDLSVMVLPQRYTRLAEQSYRYESRGGRFRADLDVDDLGLVVRYGTFWERVAGT